MLNEEIHVNNYQKKINSGSCSSLSESQVIDYSLTGKMSNNFYFQLPVKGKCNTHGYVMQGAFLTNDTTDLLKSVTDFN